MQEGVRYEIPKNEARGREGSKRVKGRGIEERKGRKKSQVRGKKE
jgi:hypothetical protein